VALLALWPVWLWKQRRDRLMLLRCGRLWLLLRERITAVGYLAAATIVTGWVVMTSRGLSTPPNLGDWILLGAVPLVGFTDAYSKKVLRDVPPVTVGLGRYLFGTAFLAVLLAAVELGSLATLVSVWALLLAAGLFSALAMAFFYWSIKRLGPSLAAGLLAAAPVVTVGLEWWWLGTPFAWAQLLGVGLVIVGVAVLARQRRVSG
jgi:drug/metabolite transporter (DMT)-like permease